MNLKTLLLQQESSLIKRIKKYKNVVEIIRSHLDKNPDDWGRFQSDFNMEINGIFRELMNFEKECMAKGDEKSIYKLKRLFINRLRQNFLHGDYIKWSLNKPFGYAGDFKIIDDIYMNLPTTQGFERLYDNYYQMCAICSAVRNRKEDFKKIIINYIQKNPNKALTIMDLASGPGRDVCEIFNLISEDHRRLSFHLYDADDKAISYAKKIINNSSVSFFKENAVRIALKKRIEDNFPIKYDLIFSTGLFDYLDYRVAVRLVSNLKKLLKPAGILAISDVRDKFSNPSIYYMEWVADWNLTYRTDEEFREIFLEAGFDSNQLTFQYEQQGVMQYILARA